MTDFRKSPTGKIYFISDLSKVSLWSGKEGSKNVLYLRVENDTGVSISFRII